jgi:hypothetical protein
MTTKITKIQLIDILNQWGSLHINTEQFQHWMLDNFEPDEFTIGEGESTSTIEAMHIVMNEYEIADQNKCLAAQFKLAIDFINTNKEDFIVTRHAFLQRAFCD